MVKEESTGSVMGEQPVGGRLDEDGFIYYTCKGCNKEKLAALFMPIQISQNTLICRVCDGEVAIHTGNHNNRKGKKATDDQREFNPAISTVPIYTNPHGEYVTQRYAGAPVRLTKRW